MEIKNKTTVTEVTLTLTAEEFRVLRLMVGSVGGATRYGDVDLYISPGSDPDSPGINNRDEASHEDRILARDLCSKIYCHKVE